MSRKKSKSYEPQGVYMEYRTRSFDSGHIMGIDFTDNDEQRELIRLMNENNLPVVFCTGDAGTGKTFTALAAALDLVKIQRKFSKIIYIREPLEVGKSLGFLPGSVDEKFDVYLGGLNDNLETIAEFSGINKNDLKSCIESIPPQYTRGRSFQPGTILIVDEAQNLSLDTIQTLATRLGKFCKIVFTGSMNQIDIKGKTPSNNDFKIAMDIFQSIDEHIAGFITLVKSERSEYCRIIDQAFTQYKQKKEQP